VDCVLSLRAAVYAHPIRYNQSKHISISFYTVSQKRDPDIIDCNSNKKAQLTQREARDSLGI